MQKTKGEQIKAVDEMVALRYRKACRDASGLDFDKLEDDTEILLTENLTAYINKLESLVGGIGVKILGRKVWQKVNTEILKKLKNSVPTLADGIRAIVESMNTSGDVDDEEHGKLKVTKLEGNKLWITSTLVLNDFYQMGLIESVIAGYGFWPTKSERTKSRPDYNQSEFYFEWS